VSPLIRENVLSYEQDVVSINFACSSGSDRDNDGGKSSSKSQTIGIPSCHYDAFQQTSPPSADTVTIEDLGKFTEYNPPIKEAFIKQETYTSPFNAEPLSGLEFFSFYALLIFVFIGRHLCAIAHPDFRLDYSPITLSGMSFFEDDRQMNRNPLLLLKFERLRFDVLRNEPEDDHLFEPVYFNIALYSLAPRVKLSEDIYIDFITPESATSSGPLSVSSLSSKVDGNIRRVLFSLGDEELMNVAVVIKAFKTVSQETSFGTDEYYLGKQVLLLCFFFRIPPFLFLFRFLKRRKRVLRRNILWP
jgi:hypothetical protein